MKEAKFDFSSVLGISGTGQVHNSFIFNYGIDLFYSDLIVAFLQNETILSTHQSPYMYVYVCGSG